MKIGFLYRFFPSIGGVERVMSVLANEFVSKGEEVVFYSFQQKLETPFYPLDTRIVVKFMPNATTIDSGNNIDFLAGESKTECLDLFFNHDTTSDSMSLCAALKIRTGLPVITLHHGQIYLPKSSLQSYVRTLPHCNPRRYGFYLYFLYDRIKRSSHHRKNIAICDAYVLLSAAFKQQLQTRSNEVKLHAIGNPLSFPETYDIHDYPNKENWVLMVGRISEYHKRFSLALRVWQEIESDDKCKDWSLIIVGDGPDRDFVLQTIRQSGCLRVQVTGSADPLEYYRKSKILFMTSAFEGFPLVLTEAMQNACVPIAMDSFEALRDIIEDRENGLIIPNNDIASYVHVAKSLMSDASELTRIASAALISSKRFSPARIADTWIQLFKTILQ